MAAELAAGKWDFNSSDNFDAYLKAIGVGMGLRLIVNKLKPSQHISISGDVWTIKTVSTFKNAESTFKLGETFDDKTPDGRTVKATCTVEGNKLIRREEGEIGSTTIREFSKDDFKMTMECKGVTSTRIYKRAPEQ